VNGNVLGYNYSFNVTASEHGADAGDIAMHGNYPYANLFEGNVVQHIWIDNSHGANGPYNLYFRNRAARNGFNMTDSKGHKQSVIGNECFKGGLYAQLTAGDGYRLQGSDHFAYGNNSVADGLQPPNTGDLADYSYYLGPNPTQPPPLPSWWKITNAIPTIGPPNARDPAKIIPATARYAAGGVMTVGTPTLYQQPTNLLVNQGQPAAFSVGAVGTPAAAYQWYRNGSILGGKTNATLAIPSAAPSHAGTYHVVVSDPDGSVRSADATLQVNAMPGVNGGSLYLFL
jgi:hypothetical protein